MSKHRCFGLGLAGGLQAAALPLVPDATSDEPPPPFPPAAQPAHRHSFLQEG